MIEGCASSLEHYKNESLKMGWEGRGARLGGGLTMAGLRTRREVTGCPLRRQLSPTAVPGDTSGSYLYGGNLQPVLQTWMRCSVDPPADLGLKSFG